MTTSDDRDYAALIDRGEARAVELHKLADTVAELAADVHAVHEKLTTDLDVATLSRVGRVVDRNTTRSVVALGVAIAAMVVSSVSLFVLMLATAATRAL